MTRVHNPKSIHSVPPSGQGRGRQADNRHSTDLSAALRVEPFILAASLGKQNNPLARLSYWNQALRSAHYGNLALISLSEIGPVEDAQRI